MTHPCPKPPETLAGVLALGLADAARLLEDTADAPERIILEDGCLKMPGTAPDERMRALRACLAHETLARVPLDAAPDARCAPAWTAALAAACDLQQARWASAWRQLRGWAIPAYAWRAPDETFADRLAHALEGAMLTPSVRFCTREGFSQWIDWARTTLAPALEHAEAKTLAQVTDHADMSAAAPAPRTIAGALRIAIDEGRRLVRREGAGAVRYRFDSSRWHGKRLSSDAPCAVCAAGAVIARRLDGSRDEDLTPGHFAPAWRASLHAIDEIRTNLWFGAFNLMHGVPKHPGARQFAERAPEPSGCEHWDDTEGYARWLDYAARTLVPIIEIAEADALQVR